MNISGNYSMDQREIDAVKEILDENHIAYRSVEKYERRDDADILVTLENGRQFLIEVKEEILDRFTKYNKQLGIDFISAFQFRSPAFIPVWKGLRRPPVDMQDFWNSIDKTNRFKGGKVYYSKSDLWLFFVKDGDRFVYYEFFDGNFMISEEFKQYLYAHCEFAVNNKPSWQMSHGDSHNSAVFFINHNDAVLNEHRIDISEYCNGLK